MSEVNSITKVRFEFAQTAMVTKSFYGEKTNTYVRISFRGASFWMPRDSWEAFKTLFRDESEEAILTIQETKRYREAR